MTLRRGRGWPVTVGYSCNFGQLPACDPLAGYPSRRDRSLGIFVCDWSLPRPCLFPGIFSTSCRSWVLSSQLLDRTGGCGLFGAAREIRCSRKSPWFDGNWVVTPLEVDSTCDSVREDYELVSGLRTQG